MDSSDYKTGPDEYEVFDADTAEEFQEKMDEIMEERDDDLDGGGAPMWAAKILTGFVTIVLAGLLYLIGTNLLAYTDVLLGAVFGLAQLLAIIAVLYVVGTIVIGIVSATEDWLS